MFKATWDVVLSNLIQGALLPMAVGLAPDEFKGPFSPDHSMIFQQELVWGHAGPSVRHLGSELAGLGQW